MVIATDDLFLHAQLRRGSKVVEITNRRGEVILKFIGSSDRNTLKRGIVFCDAALIEATKPTAEQLEQAPSP